MMEAHGVVQPIAQLVAEWREQALSLRRYGAKAQAMALEACASDLEQHLEDWQHDLLTLSEAAELSGYSTDHLGRLVRTGKIPNAGRPGAPRILRRDLPRVPGHGVDPRGGREEPVPSRVQMARSVVESE